MKSNSGSRGGRIAPEIEFGQRTPRELYEYTNGRVDVRFRHAKYDWLQMRIRASGRGCRVSYLDDEFGVVGSELFQGRRQTVSCRLAAVFCPFISMIQWLEAMTTGVQICAFEWEGEGPDGYMGWDYNRLIIRWPTGSENERVLEVFPDSKQVVSAFYTAFRRFVESTEYHPERYEPLRHGAPLRELRSDVVEQWLGWSAQRDALLAAVCAGAVRDI